MRDVCKRPSNGKGFDDSELEHHPNLPYNQNHLSIDNFMSTGGPLRWAAASQQTLNPEQYQKGLSFPPSPKPVKYRGDNGNGSSPFQVSNRVMDVSQSPGLSDSANGRQDPIPDQQSGIGQQATQFLASPAAVSRDPTLSGTKNLQEDAGYNIAQNLHQSSPEVFEGVLRYCHEQGMLVWPRFHQAPSSARDSGISRTQRNEGRPWHHGESSSSLQANQNPQAHQRAQGEDQYQ